MSAELVASRPESKVLQSIFAVLNMRIDMPSQPRHHFSISCLPANSGAPIAVGCDGFPTLWLFLLDPHKVVACSKVC